jgi:GNAT superfamily N-acetyltransferase
MLIQIAAASTAALPLDFEPDLLRIDRAAPRAAEPGTSFAVPADLGLGPAPRSLPPIRPPRGWVPDVLRSERLPGGIAVATTALEAAGLTMLLCDPDTALVVPFGHVLSYREVAADGVVLEGRHRPEAVARRRDGAAVAYTFIHSWERDTAMPGWPRTEAAVRAAYRRLGVGFRVLTEHTLFARNLRENRARMLRERAGCRDADVARVLAALVRHGPSTTVARFHRRARPFPARRLDRTLSCVIELAMAGDVALDLRNPLGPETRITQGART